MSFPTSRRPSIEPLEARIALALTISNFLPDIVAGVGKTGATVDLSKIFDADAEAPNRTIVQFTTNLDADPTQAGLQAGVIKIELFDDVAPLTVQNFLTYVVNRNPRGDYDGTIIHRSFDFGTNSGPGRDIVQGGGFEIPNPAQHIPVGPQVHNDFSEARPNAPGTIAMAKTALGPNTATSEWFFNVNDNAEILGEANNEGFTVFGTVIEGFDVVQAIANQPVRNVFGFQDFPVQNYNADPDNNPDTPAATVQPQNIIRITDAAVLPNAPGQSSGISFSVVNVVPVGETTSPNLLTASVKNQTLTLQYGAGKSGVVDVTVRASMAGEEAVEDTFRVTVRPNLYAEVAQERFEPLLVPGDTGSIKVELTNNGGALARGTVDLRFSLAEVDPSRENALVEPLVRMAVGEINDARISIASGGTATVSGRLALPPELFAESGTRSRLIVEIVPSGTQLFTDDDTALDGNLHETYNRFGTFTESGATRTNAVLQYAELDAGGARTGDFATFSMRGAGFGQLNPATPGVVDLAISRTGGDSVISAKVGRGDGHIAIRNLEATNPIGAANLGLIDTSGFVTFSEGVRTVTLGDVTGEALLTIGAFAPDNAAKATVNLGRVREMSMESVMPLASLTAREWLDQSGTENFILAPSLNSLRITGGGGVSGDFEADVTLDGDLKLSTFSVAGFLRNATVRSAADVGTVTLGGMDRASFFVGTAARPVALEDFEDERSLDRLTIAGIRGFSGNLFLDSQVAADQLGTIRVQRVDTTSGDSDFGFVADSIRSYNRLGGARASNLETAPNFDRAGNYVVSVLAAV